MADHSEVRVYNVPRSLKLITFYVVFFDKLGLLTWVLCSTLTQLNFFTKF